MTPSAHRSVSRFRRRVRALVLALAALAATATLGPVHTLAQSGVQAPEGYRVVDSPDLPAHLVEVTADSAFSLHVDRDVSDEGHRQMIHIAERLVPTAETMDELIEADIGDRELTGGWPMRFQEAREAEDEFGPRWWYLYWDGVLTPMALGAPSVHHYLDLLRSRAAGENPFGDSAHSGRMQYSASVQAVEGEHAAETPWVVVLEVHFRYQCGSLCAMSFPHDRRVYFDAEGNPVRIEGDRPPNVLVS